MSEIIYKFKWLWLVVAICFVMGAQVTLADYEVGLTHGTNKHRPEFPFENLDEYQIYSAKNEWEPFQVLIRDDDGVSNVNVTVSEFTGPGDNIAEIDLYRIHYVPVYADEISHQPPDPSHAGDWPDGLVPFVDHFVHEERDGAPFDVPADYAQGVFVDVYVPAGQTPGNYEATVTVTASGHTDWTGTVNLTVWDFELPNSNSIVTNYSYSRDGLCEYHQANGNTVDCEELHARYFESYARHRMGAYRWITGNPPYTYNADSKSLDVDWSDWNTYHAPYMNGTFYKPGYEFDSVNLPRSFANVPSGLTQDEWNHLHWQSWAQNFKANGWIEKLWCYMPDEPDPSQYQGIADMAAKIHAADPDLQPFITEQYTEELGDDVDIWCPDEPLFSDSMPWPPYPEKYEELRADGKKTWWYNCVSATLGFDYANHMVDEESTYMRIWLWLTRRYGFTGILFWRIQYLWNTQDVWDSMYAEKFLCQGDGTMYYPGVPSKIGGTTDIPIPSIRIKILREAMEDYEYFALLDNAGEEEWVDDVTRTVAPKTYQWEHDWEKLLAWRKIVAEKILGTLDEVPPDAPTGLSAASQVESVDLSWTAPADSDLAGFEVWYAIYEGDAFFGGNVDASTTSITVTGLAPGQEHMFWVRAFDETGNRSDDSDIATSTPQGDSSFEESPNAVSLTDSRDSGDGDGDDVDDDEFFGCGGW